MSFTVSTGGFEGPFDLLLTLVTRQKVDIGAVNVSDIADQYLSEVRRLGDLDLDVASDFLLVASTLLELKASTLVGEEAQATSEEDDELEAALSPDELRSVLIERLVVYRQFKAAAAALFARGEAESHMHPRNAGPDPEFASISPDYLSTTPLTALAQICARLDGQRERFLLESEHIAKKRIPLETRVEQVDSVVREKERLTFDELLGDDTSAEELVVSLLALLELQKRDAVTLEQRELFGTIWIEHVPGASAFVASTESGELTSEDSSLGVEKRG